MDESRTKYKGASSQLCGWGKELTDVETLEVFRRLKGDIYFIRWRILARTIECERESRDLAGLRLHWRRHGLTGDGEEAKNSGEGKGFHFQ